MSHSSVFSKPTFLENLDIFGIAIAIRFNSLPSHNTRFGGLVTVTIIGIILFQLISVLKTLFQQTTPQVIQQNAYVYQPEPFQIKPNSYIFAIGLQDSHSIQFMNEQIYKVQALQQSLVRVLNSTTGLYDQVWSSKNITLIPCTQENFQIPESQHYFLSQAYTKMYCFNPNEQNAIIEGEFSALVFRQLILNFNECIGPGCASDTIKQQFISNPNLGLFMSNNIIQITDKYNPYVSIGKNLYWPSGSAFEKVISINLINNYINSDFSYYENNWQQDRVVSFSSSSESVVPRTSSTMFQLKITYEKNLQVNYQRSYLKLDTAFSQLGGMFNGLLALGFLICRPLSQLELNRKLLNSVFHISKEDQEELDKDLKGTKLENKNDETLQKDQIDEKCSPSAEPKSPDISDVLMKSKDLKKSLRLKANSKVKKEDLNNYISNFFKVQFSELQIKLTDYFASYLSFFKRFQTAKQKLITYGTNKLYSQIDIFYIINKLNELEKLKYLLLDDQQIKLFEYLPRPQLKLQEVFQEEKNEKQQENEKKKKDSEKANQSFGSPTTDQFTKKKKPTITRTTTNQFIMFGQDDKGPLQKAQDAQKAFNFIQKKSGHRSNIDEKLIRMLNPKLVNMLMENSFDFGEEEEDLTEFNIKQGFEKSSVLLKKSIFQQNDISFKLDKSAVDVDEVEKKDILDISGIHFVKNEISNQKQQHEAHLKCQEIQLAVSQSIEGVKPNTVSHKQDYIEENHMLEKNSQNIPMTSVDNDELLQQPSFTSTPQTTQRIYQENADIIIDDQNELIADKIQDMILHERGEGEEEEQDDRKNNSNSKFSNQEHFSQLISSAARSYFEENKL